MKIILFIIFAGSISIQGTQDKLKTEYFWRDFTGSIPDDAFIAGIRDDGLAVSFVGQVVHVTEEDVGVLVPAHIDDSQYVATYAYAGTVYNVSHNFKIFCTSESEQYQWIQTDTIGVRYLLPHHHLPVGGFHKDFPLLIGKTETGDIGKVTIQDSFGGLYAVVNGSPTLDQVFRVLSYNASC